MENVDVKFRPSFPDICDFFCLIIDLMIVSVSELPCIENLLFQVPDESNMKTISCVKVEDELVEIAKARIKDIVMKNSFGPTR